jgi:uncharacterized membrane protein
MRTSSDRIRHTLLFELIALALITPVASWVLDKSLVQIGSLGIALSLIAMCVNYFYNFIFDIALIRMGRAVNKRPVWLRLFHAILFETCLIVLTIPVVAWWLDMILLEAFITDIGFTLFFLIYAFIFNWTYDVIFPMPA